MFCWCLFVSQRLLFEEKTSSSFWRPVPCIDVPHFVQLQQQKPNRQQPVWNPCVCVLRWEKCVCVRARAKNRRGRFTKQKITKVERAAIDICWRVTLELRFENRKNEKTAQTHKCNAIIFFSSGRAIVMMMMMIAVFDKKPMSNSHLCHHSLIKRLYHCIMYTPLPLSNRKTAIVRCIFPKLANTHLSND